MVVEDRETVLDGSVTVLPQLAEEPGCLDRRFAPGRQPDVVDVHRSQGAFSFDSEDVTRSPGFDPDDAASLEDRHRPLVRELPDASEGGGSHRTAVARGERRCSSLPGVLDLGEGREVLRAEPTGIGVELPGAEVAAGDEHDACAAGNGACGEVVGREAAADHADRPSGDLRSPEVDVR